MKFYGKYYANNYEELITYYPRFYRDVFEMVEILKAHGRIADGIEGNIEQTYLNGFVDYADEATLEKMEEFLGIELNKNSTIEERRRLVKSYFVGFGKVSSSLICQVIATYTNATTVTCTFEPFDDEGNNLLYINFQRSLDSELIYISQLHRFLSRKLPAHIKYRINESTEVEFDNKNLEQIILRNIRLKIGIPFFCGFVFDGSLLFDGSAIFNSRKRYWLLPAIRCKLGIAATESVMPYRLSLGWEQSIIQADLAAGAGCSVSVSGLSEKAEASLTAGMDIDSSGEETVENVTAETKTSDYCFFDGTVLFDGTRKFNSIYRKEAVD